MSDRIEAKAALDTAVGRSRVRLYKPIQIAEILCHDRVLQDINLLEPGDYRAKSKRWRDDICRNLLEKACASGAKFQDDLFNDAAIPPVLIKELGKENRRTNCGAEAYIYNRFICKHSQLSDALNYRLDSTKGAFFVKDFIDSFWKESELKRSLDKIHEIIAYALFSTLVDALDLQVEVSVKDENADMLSEFSDFAEMVMRIDFSNPNACANWMEKSYSKYRNRKRFNSMRKKGALWKIFGKKSETPRSIVCVKRLPKKFPQLMRYLLN